MVGEPISELSHQGKVDRFCRVQKRSVIVRRRCLTKRNISKLQIQRNNINLEISVWLNHLCNAHRSMSKGSTERDALFDMIFSYFLLLSL